MFNGTIFFDISCEERSCYSKDFYVFASTGRHRGFTAVYKKHNLFHQSELSRDVVHRNKHIIVFKTPCVVMRLKTLGAPLGRGSETVDWYREATYIPYVVSVIDFSPQTGGCLPYCTNCGIYSSKLLMRKRLKHIQPLDYDYTKCLHLPSNPLFLTRVQKSSPGVLPKKLVQKICECIVKRLKANLQVLKKSDLVKWKFQEKVRLQS